MTTTPTGCLAAILTLANENDNIREEMKKENCCTYEDYIVCSDTPICQDYRNILKGLHDIMKEKIRPRCDKFKGIPD